MLHLLKRLSGTPELDGLVNELIGRVESISRQLGGWIESLKDSPFRARVRRTLRREKPPKRPNAETSSSPRSARFKPSRSRIRALPRIPNRPTNDAPSSKANTCRVNSEAFESETRVLSPESAILNL